MVGGYNLNTKNNIVVIGDIFLDEYIFGNINRISPEAPVQILNEKNIEYRLGGAANLAANIKNLGSKVLLISTCGSDNEAKEIKKLLKKRNIKNKVFINKKYSTIKKTRFVSLYPNKQQILRVDREMEDSNFNIEIDSSIRSIISKAKLVLISDYGKGFVKNISSIKKLCKLHKIKILIDPKGDDFKKYSGVYLLKPNLKEFINIVGKYKSESEFNRKAIKLCKSLNLNYLLITSGSNGVYLCHKNSIMHYPNLKKVEVFDVTGAGDTLLAALGYMISRNENINNSINFSLSAASISVSKFGTSLANIEEIFQINKEFPKSNIRPFIKYISNLKKNNTIVMTNGCFDILHAGHIHFFKEAKSKGDILIVAVNDDYSVKLNKGKNRPINSLKDRKKVLSSISYIDYIIDFSEKDPSKLILELNPNILVKGSDYKINQIINYKKILKKGIQISLIEHYNNKSTSNIIKNINNL